MTDKTNTNELLEEKYKVQMFLNEKAGNDLKKYFDNLHKIVTMLEKNRKIKFKTKKINHY